MIFSYTFAEMKLESFLMERLQSTWENRVAWNLSESGVHPLRLEELAVSEEDRAALFGQELGYTQTNGTPELRAAITSLYPAARVDNVLVTNGGSEANCIALWHLLEPGDEIVMMMPNYMQLRGIARGLGATVRPWALVERDGRWRADLDGLAGLVSPATRLIAICNPNNPTGGASVVRGGRRNLPDCRTRRCVGVVRRNLSRRGTRQCRDAIDLGPVRSRARHQRAVEGVRPSRSADRLGGRSGTIGRGTVGRPRLHLDRARCAERQARAGRTGAAATSSSREPAASSRPTTRWSESGSRSAHRLLTHVAPEAGAIVLVRYRHPINSTALVERLRDEQSVLLVPGDHFDMDGYLRIGFGNHPAYVSSALELRRRPCWTAWRDALRCAWTSRSSGSAMSARRFAMLLERAARTPRSAMRDSTAASSGWRRGATAERSTGTASIARTPRRFAPCECHVALRVGHH